MMYVTGVGPNRGMVEVKRLRPCLCLEKEKALLGFHVVSGCVVTGCLARKGKASFWKTFQTLDAVVLASLG